MSNPTHAVFKRLPLGGRNWRRWRQSRVRNSNAITKRQVKMANELPLSKPQREKIAPLLQSRTKSVVGANFAQYRPKNISKPVKVCRNSSNIEITVMSF